MSLCDGVKSYSERHEWVSDLFSVLGVGVLFATIWFLTTYYTELLSWLDHNMLLHLPLLVGATVVDVFLIFGLICLGSTRCEEGGCFRTFRGRRHGGPSIGSIFSSWLHHMENVGKKHR